MSALNPPMATTASVATPSRMRYGILLMIFIVTIVNYADRATLSVTGPAMREEFGFDAIQMGYIFSAFSWAYVMALVSVLSYLVIVKDIQRIELKHI